MTSFSAYSFTQGDNVLHVVDGTHSSSRMPSFFSGFNHRLPDGVIDGYPRSTWAGLMTVQAPGVAVGSTSATIKKVSRTGPYRVRALLPIPNLSTFFPVKPIVLDLTNASMPTNHQFPNSKNVPQTHPFGHPWQWKPKYVIRQFKLREVLRTEALGSINTRKSWTREQTMTISGIGVER